MPGKQSISVILIEGPECAGKTTLFRRLQETPYVDGVDFVTEIASLIGEHWPLGTGASRATEVAFLTLNGSLIERLRANVATSRRSICDRGWQSQLIYSRVRSKLFPSYECDPDLFELQETVIFRLFPELLSTTGLLYLDVTPSESLLRSRISGPDRIPAHQPDVDWVTAVDAEYRRYLSHLDATGILTYRRIDGDGSPSQVLKRAMIACDEMGFPLAI